MELLKNRLPEKQSFIRHTAVALGSLETLVSLTFLGWRYSLESAGFSNQQSKRIIFFKWLYENRPAEFTSSPEKLYWESDLKENNAILNNLSTF